jgi:excisionase family DNA binding protein
MTTLKNDPLFDKAETGKYLRIATSTVDRHLHNGLLVPTRIGGRVFFRKSTLDAFLAGSEREARREASERRKNVNA